MNEQIKKSLLDKNTSGFNYNPQIQTNSKIKTIKERLISNLNDSKRINIAVSYVVWSGLSLIYDDLKKFDRDSKILLSIDGFVTDVRSLRKLLELNLNVKVYDPFTTGAKGFHLKSYQFQKDDYTTILIGSNNISARAFGLAHEMAVEVDSMNEGMFVEKFNDAFESVWNDPASRQLNESFIDGYEAIYHEKMIMNNQIFELGLDDDEIRPNYMQQAALKELEEARKLSNKGLVIAATGTGKTYLSAFDVKNSKAKKVLFLVHNRLILSSAIKSYKKIFPHGKKFIELKSSNIEDIPEANFIFTTDKTAHSHLLNKVSQDYFDYIIYDEAHRIGEDTLYFEIMKYFNPKFSLGITATPERTTDSKYLFQRFDYNVIYEIRLLDALQHELICPFTYYGLDLDEKLLKNNQEFDFYELGLFIDELIKEKGHYGTKLKAIVFASDKAEATSVSAALSNLGYNSVVAISDGTSFDDTKEYLDSLQSNDEGSVEVICSVNKLNEGVDIPDVNTIIMLRNTTSSIIYLQQLGRGLRRTKDPHKFVTVFDIIGNSKNNYSIAQVLTANTTADKRMLYKYAGTQFETVSPFINVFIDEQAMENIIKSISNNFTVKSQIRTKFKDELSRYKLIPTLKEMYLNPVFNELDLLQLTYKNFYEPFETYYIEKYDIAPNSIFLRKLFDLITQFTFRGYDSITLKDYVQLLKGIPSNNAILKHVLLPKAFDKGITSAINSEYHRKTYGLPSAFITDQNNNVCLNPKIIDKLKQTNAFDLFEEHIELFDCLSKRDDYQMKTFDLVDKGEFLFNVGAKDAYMNGVGEMEDNDKRAVYCTINITDKESFYDNYIVDNNKIIYYTQNNKSKATAEKKLQKWIDEKYDFYICAKFPHLGYSKTSYFNLGKLSITNVSDVLESKPNKFNHEIEFVLEEELPLELMMYKD